MPKTKKVDDSSDSDSSGPLDRNPPPASKKQKTEPEPEPKKAVAKKSSGGAPPKRVPDGDGDDETWPLDKKRSVKINEFRGKLFVDIREYYEDKDGEQKPGKKGISLSMEQYRKFKDIIPEIDEALKNH